MALTKAVSAVDAWQAVAQNTIVEGATVDCSTYYQAMMSVQVALTSTTATTNGFKVICHYSTKSTGDDKWTELASVILMAGTTAATQNLTNNPAAAGTTVFTCASTTGFATRGVWIYIKDSTIGNSEIGLETTFSSNTSVTVLDGSTNSHAQNTPMWNQVAFWNVLIPDEAQRVRIIYDNTQDAAGSTADVRAELTAITGI